MTVTRTTSMSTPVGDLVLVANSDGQLTHLLFKQGQHPVPLPAGTRSDVGPFTAVIDQLEEYFAGNRRVFDLPLAPRGTRFQLAAWEALRRIPYGETRSYAAQAAAIGRPAAVRAVGAANGANPISIVVPCHRVVGANGSLIGYGGGIDRKRRLLALESGAQLALDLPGIDALI